MSINDGNSQNFLSEKYEMRIEAKLTDRFLLLV